jgi:lipopolysaccharide transport system ATP-binding protein
MSSEFSIRVQSVSKCFYSYERPQDRLVQGLTYLAARFAGGTLRRRLLERAQSRTRQFWALRDISFDVLRGETVGIIGRNGSGKSTLLQIICGTLAQTGGRVEVQGRVAALLELGSGFNPEYSGRDNIYINAQVYGLTRPEIDARLDEIIAFADIGEFIDQPVKSYSSGMYVRLAFSVIAHVDASVLIIDEALAVGDAFFTQKCMRFLRHFMETGTVLFVSHDTASVKALCSKVVWLEHGQVVRTGEPKEVCDAYLEAFYEAQQGKSTTTRMRTADPLPKLEPVVDQRLQFINQTVLRNDLKVFEFNPDADSFGARGAEIVGVDLLDQSMKRLSWIVGGEWVVLRITARIFEELEAPIIGFEIRDRTGQVLFGDNTYLSYLDTPLHCTSSEDVQALFEFAMPIMPKGDYSISAAIASGTQHEHKQHHWMLDAVIFRSDSPSAVRGLIGIPMHRIQLEKVRQGLVDTATAGSRAS